MYKRQFKNRTEIVRSFSDYFYFGGLPELELIEEIEKRQWLSNLFNKTFFGDLITRYSIRNDLAMKVLIRKLAESVKQPSSFNRLSNIVSSTGIKVTTDTVIDYLEFLQATWLIFSIENYASKLVEKVSNQKYYFIDNGLLNLFLIDPETSLLENLVAISLKKKYEEELYFYPVSYTHLKYSLLSINYSSISLTKALYQSRITSIFFIIKSFS